MQRLSQSHGRERTLVLGEKRSFRPPLSANKERPDVDPIAPVQEHALERVHEELKRLRTCASTLSSRVDDPRVVDELAKMSLFADQLERLMP